MSELSESTAKELADAMLVLFDMKVKLQAFEDVLKTHNPNLHREKEARIGHLKDDKAFGNVLLGSEGLRLRLSQLLSD